MVRYILNTAMRGISSRVGYIFEPTISIIEGDIYNEKKLDRTRSTSRSQIFLPLPPLQIIEKKCADVVSISKKCGKNGNIDDYCNESTIAIIEKDIYDQ